MTNDSNETIFLDANTSLCPCGSGLLLVNCCITLRSDTCPSLPKTGISNPRCYACSLNDCESKVTKEHFVSQSVLKIVSTIEGRILLSGSPWLGQNEVKPVNTSGLAANILCSRHNTSLSPLDSIGRKFFDFIMGKDVQSEFLMVNGDEIERWMLKVLCGGLSSGFFGPEHKGWQPPDEWLQILFGSGIVPDGSGLYILSGRTISAPLYQLIAWPIDGQTEINGLFFSVGGCIFLFFMGSPHPDFALRTINMGWKMNYRPECLVLIDATGQREVHFGAPPRLGFVTIDSS